MFIITSKINWRKISLNEYFKAISHYLFQCLLFTFGVDARSSSSSLFWLKFISPFLIIIAKTLLQSQGSSLAQVLKLMKVVHFDRSGHLGWSDRNVPFHLTKLLSPVLLLCILLARTISKRAVAWLGSVQTECIIPFGRVSVKCGVGVGVHLFF